MRYNDAETLATVTDSIRRPPPRHTTTSAVQAIENADASMEHLDRGVKACRRRRGDVHDAPLSLERRRERAGDERISRGLCDDHGSSGRHRLQVEAHVRVGYSKAPGFGKSYTLARRFAKTYNAAVVADIKNWTNVSRRAQFIVFDEVGHTPIANWILLRLKAIAGGAATGASGNMMKTFGDSYVPHKDVWLTLMSNESIYDVCGAS